MTDERHECSEDNGTSSMYYLAGLAPEEAEPVVEDTKDRSKYTVVDHANEMMEGW